ncbi:DUF4905 domain-containing protein [Mucilaginibacter pallidiroseus]|uniref:DUF4905 domain-containing protein n=1 Tax=Mucilaginibacter pallidiroseus TaxID=2599295 RepID=A0A563UBZ9_9SPHI|nr:DUF4905 domain-containing protein [Mucilaginibacter pallidiroseus]TWR28813.1 DUF4905 domain-containing protein [Mucilaginibacter pallidiroseus]
MTMLQPSIQKKFNGTIWRLEFDELSSVLALEIRNQQDKQTSFTSIDINTGNINFEGLTTPERWLTGIECVYNNVLLLHHYKNESGPEHRAVIGIDATNGQTLWSNYSLAYDHLTEDGPALYNTSVQPRKLFIADIKTGTTKSPNNSAANKPLQNRIVIPDMLPAADLVPGSLPLPPYGNIVHYLRHNNYIIVSLHTQKNGSLQQHLFVMRGSEIVFTDLLNTSIQKLQPEAFVIHNNTLVFITNRDTINIINL